ncbi:hypothetical protein RCG23_14710 [Neobacillus sp. PS3-34]|uniref:TIGR03826 family flagellar region protein n=1 Tax=Neobacillus sp. PS3-34 TaxID=3070678 RepID=UPI0027E167C6|nr:TIGR03826 family flagellar region protein [Neobacillus sp. PS3-34]WML46883.1 hypothetical protein RCG23_14710 [Neobacillus sp. PS3-34]
MENLQNCPGCNEIFVKTQFRDVCPKCWKQEENDYETVYTFMRRRENRAATIEQVVTQTGVKEDKLLKFIKKGRIQLAHFPNLGYPCDKCGHIIRTGKLCEKCQTELRQDLKQHEADEERKQEIQRREKKSAYYISEGN